MRGSRAKQLRRDGGAVGPGPDPSPGLGRDWRRQHARDAHRTNLRNAAIQYITGLPAGDKQLLDARYDWLRECGNRRLLAHVNRLSADRAPRARIAAALERLGESVAA